MDRNYYSNSDQNKAEIKQIMTKTYFFAHF